MSLLVILFANNIASLKTRKSGEELSPNVLAQQIPSKQADL
jgi:hypothetical protein